MNTYILGSHAIKSFFSDFDRVPFDKDVLVESQPEKKAEIAGDEKIEYLVIPPLYNYLRDKSLTPDVLLTLKCSHIFWDIKWEKHMFDITYLFEHGAKIIKPLFDELYAYWQEFHGNNKRSDLKMSAEDFFNNALKTYDHDVLHTYLKDIPTYTKVLKDNAEVDVCEEKFNLLTYEEKFDLVREEVYVMAFERLMNRDYRKAYSWMLKKFIISHAPIWEALFILENYRVLHKPDMNYVKHFEEQLSLRNYSALKQK